MQNSFVLDPKLSTLLTDTCIKTITSFKEIIDSEKKLHSFEIDCKCLDKRFHSNNICDSKEFKDIFDILKPIKNPVIYWFEIVSDTSHQEIIESISLYKKEMHNRATPALKKNHTGTSRILYVGKVKGSFWGRLITHLGYLRGTGQTQGLQLDGWAKSICLKLKLNVLEFEHCMSDYMTIVEYAFAKELKPIIGKHK